MILFLISILFSSNIQKVLSFCRESKSIIQFSKITLSINPILREDQLSVTGPLRVNFSPNNSTYTHLDSRKYISINDISKLYRIACESNGYDNLYMQYFLCPDFNCKKNLRKQIVK